MLRKPTVSIYVRHKSDCKHASNPSSPKCDCPKWLTYSGDICLCGHAHPGRQHRFSAGVRSWAQAEERREEAQKRLDAGDTSPLAVEDRKTIEQALKTYLIKKKSEGTGEETLRTTGRRLALFVEFMENRSRFYPSEITADDLIEYRASWTWKSGLSRQKAQSTLRGFLRYACPRPEGLIKELGRIKLSKEDKARIEPKPFTESELTGLLAQVPRTFSNPAKAALITALIHCQVSTGLAIRDAAQLQRASLTQNRLGCFLKIKRQKTDKDVRQRIAKSLYDELMAVTNGNPKYVFWNGTSLPASASRHYQRDLRRLMKDAGVWIRGNLSHRFRDTAVDTWLEMGWHAEDVADALGDTIAVVEEHYKTLLSERALARQAKLPVREWETK